MSSKALALGALALSAAFFTGSAMAWTVVPAPTTTTDGQTRYVDPDRKTDQITQDRQDARDNRTNWSRHGREDESIGAQPRDDRSYWGSPMLDNPRR